MTRRWLHSLQPWLPYVLNRQPQEAIVPTTEVIDAYKYHRLPPIYLHDIEQTGDAALSRGRDAASRLIREYDTGITVGAEEDAEIAIHDITMVADPGAALLALAELLVRALTDLQEDGQISGLVYRNLHLAVGAKNEAP